MTEKSYEIYGKKALKALAGFLCVMVFLTVLSRAAASILTPYVVVVSPGKGSLTYKVSAMGTVEENQVRAVLTAPGVRVKNVFVQEGDQVQKGDALFELDMEDLKEKILLKKQELEKLDLGISDIKDRKELEQSDKSLEQQRAGEDYNRAAGSSDAQVQRAYDAMINAGNRLKDFDGQGSSEQGDEIFTSGDPVEQALAATCEEKAAALEQKAAEVEKIQKELEAARGETMIFSDSGMTEVLPEQTMDVMDAGTLAAQPTEAELVEQLEKELKDAQAGYEAVKMEKEEADAALVQYRAGQESLNSQHTQEQRRALEEAYVQAKNAYEDMVRQRDESMSGAIRKIEDAKKPQAQDSTEKTMELDREMLVMELNKYLSQKKNKGIVKAPGTGVIRKLEVEAGYPTPDTSAVTMADLSAGSRLQAQISAEDTIYISLGDEVTVKPSDGSGTIEGLTIDSIKTDSADESLVDIGVRITHDQLKLGASAMIEAEKKSMPYAAVLPLQALHLDKEQYYVLVVQEVKNILGTELIAQRFDVKVKEKNKEMAALEPGILSGGEQIIVSSEKKVEAGDRVRLKEE